MVLNAYQNRDIKFQANGQEKMRITAAGMVLEPQPQMWPWMSLAILNTLEQ